MKKVYEMPAPDSEYISEAVISNLNLKDGTVNLKLTIPERFYYEMLTNLLGAPVENEYDFLTMLKDVAGRRREYDHVADAMKSVQMKGYGLVMPEKESIILEEPELITHAGKYGVKIRANSPSVHMIKANIETEIAPIVGSEEQAKDLIAYISENTRNNPAGIWETNIFGKSIGQLVEDGISGKVGKLSGESQIKLQDTIQKVVNDSNGGLVCIII